MSTSILNKIPVETYLHIAQYLNLASLHSWALTAKSFHHILIHELYARAVTIDTEDYKWPFYLARASVLGNVSAFTFMLARTPLAVINEANVVVDKIPRGKDYPRWRQWSGEDFPELHNPFRPSLLYASLLHVVCQLCDVKFVELVLARGVNSAVLDGMGNAPLHLAAGNDNVAVVKLLLGAGADIDVSNYRGEGFAPLHAALCEDSTSAAELLIQEGAEIEASGASEGTPLDIAARQRNLIILNRFLDSVNYSEKLLTQALEATNDESYYHDDGYHSLTVSLPTKYLLEAGASPSFKALQNACEQDYLPAIQLLIEYGVDLHRQDEFGFTIFHSVKSCEAAQLIMNAVPDPSLLVNTPSAAGRTPLDTIYLPAPEMGQSWPAFSEYAMTRDDFKIPLALLFLKHGVKVEATASIDGGSALNWAVRMGHPSVVAEILKRQPYLIAERMDIPSRCKGYTLLHSAVSPEWNSDDAEEAGELALACIRQLVKFGCDVNALDERGRSALQIHWDPSYMPMPEAQHAAVTCYLVKAGADVPTHAAEGLLRNRILFRALLCAMEHGWVRTSIILIDAGSTLSARTSEGWTVLHVAAKKGYSPIVKRLIRSDTIVQLDLARDMNAEDTPLRLAVHGGIEEEGERYAETMGYLLFGYPDEAVPNLDICVSDDDEKEDEDEEGEDEEEGKGKKRVGHVEVVRLFMRCSQYHSICPGKNDVIFALATVKMAAPHLNWDEIGEAAPRCVA